MSSTAISSAGSTSTIATTSSTSLSSSSTSSSGGGSGIPEFPFQLAAATVFTVLLTASYLFFRHRPQFGSKRN
jgi:hypothetical protein